MTSSLSSIEVLAGVVLDRDKQSRIMTVEMNGRLSERIKLFFNAAFFSDIPYSDHLYAIRDDDYVAMEIRYYF